MPPVDVETAKQYLDSSLLLSIKMPSSADVIEIIPVIQVVLSA